MLLIAGLGNPGQQYAGHRHNVGFMAADAIARRHSFSPWTKKFGALVAEGRLAGEKVLLVKPQTYMNRSGQSVGEAMRFYKLTPADLVVLYDELDLAPGKVRVKTGGGAGGHNGIRSIDQHCGRDYRRVRIGIGHPGHKDKVTGHVLGDFAKADQTWLEPLLDALADHADLLVKGDEPGFMNRISLAAPAASPARRGDGTAARGRSHIPQARPKTPQVEPPQSGPMAAMLRRLLGKGD
ncbi:aminoacyl-tRNA hydrolase [Aquibium sp. A9E412]|uniref:aminoacyl-tRNA hydrolase n=1 Tax=Aquibium sp. A9E412 TaxID=2976767 RepID=UPI0025B000D7|nr:aminoacyl-tRNA hydrolase [Aquibium sp. A9E412]MDN2566649.1 aminoacyl-tRNA hydrolase [Aquibium sp. A9E412]